MQQNFDTTRKYGYTDLSNLAAELSQSIFSQFTNPVNLNNVTTDILTNALQDMQVVDFLETHFLKQSILHFPFPEEVALYIRLKFAQKYFYDKGLIDPDVRFEEVVSYLLLSSALTDVWKKIAPLWILDDLLSSFCIFEDIVFEKKDYPVFYKICKDKKIDEKYISYI